MKKLFLLFLFTLLAPLSTFLSPLGESEGASTLHAQKLYMIKTDPEDPFSRQMTTFEYQPGDSIVFGANRWNLYHKDGSAGRSMRYSNTSDFYLEPTPGLYCPAYLKSNDFNSTSSRYCWQRSRQSKHFIVFWEAGYGLDPTKASDRYRFDPEWMLNIAEKIYEVNTQHLGFSQPGNSTTLDNYKIMMFVAYSTEWAAYGSGQDNKCGSLDVNIDALRDQSTLAHEIGHTFQYIIACDLGMDHGWRYGFGTNGDGGCAWWESCAQWQAYKVFPDEKFTDGWSSGVYSNSHLNLLHEEWRYSNFFVHDYWCQLHGEDFIGRLWKEETRPEDPVEAYKRITQTDQSGFCKDMYDYACHAITWDIDAIRSYGKNRTDQFTCPSMHRVDGYLEVDSAYCPQNYGFNILRLKNFKAGETITVDFKGMAGAKGFRAIKTDKAGWRYGFVALQNNGTRVYGEMNSAAEGTAQFTVPANTTRVWFVVLGAPTDHWRHPWNDDVKDDEQWPYRVKFTGAEFNGSIVVRDEDYEFPADYVRQDIELSVDIDVDYATIEQSTFAVNLDLDPVFKALGIKPTLLEAISPTKEPDNLRIRLILADGSESATTMSTYAYYWGLTADGTPVASFDEAAYYFLWTYYRYTLYAGGDANKVEQGKTYSPRFAFIYTHTDGHEYKATFTVNIHVK